MPDIRDMDGLTPEEEPVDQVVEGELVSGETGPSDGYESTTPDRPERVESWSEVDPDYVDLIDEGAEAEDVPDEELDELEQAGGDATGRQAPYWVSYELWGRDLNREAPWRILGTEDFDGEAELTVDDLPAGTTMEFRVRLVDNNGRHSAYSVTVPYQTPVDMTPPPPPIGIGARNEMGLVLLEWGGELSDPTPVDMSHVQFYARQMHPAGDPEGEPGDPRRLDQLAEAGTVTTIALIDRIPHEIWATAVDTTGNESLWSEVVEVTPERPADTEEIEAELEAARQERQEYRDAFDERTAEYDRLMAEQEDALAETDAWGHTAVYRADQAAAEAVAARDTAERAEDNAAIARETADGSLELQAITEPEGVGSVHGQRWVKYDHMGRDRKILGVWVWNADEETWDAVSHDVTYLPVADITQATIGDLEAQRIFAELGEIGDLAVDQITGHEARVNKLFTDTTVATSVWSQIVRTRLLEADEALIGGALIQGDAITVDHIAVTDELVFEIARGIRLEVGQLASNDIVGMNITGGTITGAEGRWGARYTGGASNGSGVLIRDDGTSGNILIYQDGDSNTQPSIRLGGQRNELNSVSVSGSFRTSNSSGRVEIEESEITYTDVWEGTTRTETVPHVSISHSSNSGDPALIAADQNGNLVFQPQGGTSSGSLVSRFTGTVESTRFLSNNYQLRTQNTSQPGGIIQSGARTVLLGRPTQEGWATQMFIQGSTSSRNMPTGSTLWSITYSSPVPQGSRFVQATAETELANNSNHRIAATTISNRTGSGFDVAATPVNGGSVYYRISWLASWE